jgi:DNA-binding beta-propeller fold protein YncE
MFVTNQRSKKRGTAAGIAIAVLLLTVVVNVSAAVDQKKTPAQPQPAKTPERIGIDISKLVWPQPPAIVRLKYQDLYTGQKIDWALVKKLQDQSAGKTKQKTSWKDRLAGTDPKGSVAVDFKMPFQLLAPTGITFDSKGKIYIGDAKVGAIFIYDPVSKATSFILGGTNAHFGQTVGLAMDDNDRLFVADAKLRRVTVISPKGQEEDSFGHDVMLSPAGLAIDHENRFLYVVDSQLDQVLVYDADSFKLLRRIGTTGKKHTLVDPGNFSLPTHCAVDADGNLYVTDTLNNRVEVFDADGKFIREWGKAGDGPGRFGRPKGISVDRDGHVWVADAMLQRVQVFDQQGQLLMYFGQEGTLAGQFSALAEVAVDKNTNRVVTIEDFPARAQIFGYVTDDEAAAEQKRREQEREQKSADRKGSINSADKPGVKAPEKDAHAAGRMPDMTFKPEGQH